MRKILATLLALAPLCAAAQTKLVFYTNWFAQAEHGGFYQAQAEGLYRKHGLDVQIRMGGPQVNGLQLLLAGQMDVFMGYDLQTLATLEQGLPLVTIAATFQKDPAVLIAHPGVKRIEDLKGRPVFISTASNTTFWPWLAQRYGFADAQKRPYAFSVQPFLADRNSAQQGYVTSEPHSVEKAGVKPVVFLLADHGYPPYAQTLVTTRAVLQAKSDALRRFVQATAEGWKSYLAGPAPGNALIRKDNPQMESDLIDFGLRKMKEHGLVTGGDAAKLGIMAMTDARWQRTHRFMVEAKLLKKPVDPRQAYTLEILKDVRVLP
jgi:NitT/TauT family transport system substrate-binding protein